MSAKASNVAVLFVCLGNICRSPTAEAVFQQAVDNRTETEMASRTFTVDSCGTGGGSSNWYEPNGFSFHQGEPADPRMAQAAVQRDICMTSRSRPLEPEDLTKFDILVAMDDQNVSDIFKAAEFWGPSYLEAAKTKVVKMMDYASDSSKHGSPVPDPYYSGGFDVVLDLLEDACMSMLSTLQQN